VHPVVIEAYLDGALTPAATLCEAALASSATVAAADGLQARLQPHEAAVLALLRERVQHAR
jgi:hypothetical protein